MLSLCHMDAGNARRKKFHVAFLERIGELSTAGFGLVAALAWNNVIQEVVNDYIKPYLPAGSGLISLTIYAAIVTALAVIITVYLSGLIEKLSQSSSQE